MALADGTEVGSVTIPPNRNVPKVGQIIEVEYLYAHRGGSLTQAVYKGVREDVDADSADSLHYKGEER
jgi:bifunctional non-homologous end joining protein LigD